ncbi:MAG: glycosyltransferase, partial [Alphaproteobacteria bacterium]
MCALTGVCTTASAVLNIHREGPLLAATLRSILHARDIAHQAGYRLEVLAVADRADADTLRVLGRFAEGIDRVIHVDFGDLGAARQAGIDAASQDWVFLHDGDDLFSSNWYLRFFERAAAGAIDPGTVYHTQVFARFGDLYDLRELIASDDPRFDPNFLATEWYFSNKSVAHRSLYRRFPLPHNDVRTGLGNEDWAWSCDTIHHGVRHDVLPETICFYRVKPQGKSLGLTPGMIHGPSPLFAPEAVVARMRARAIRPAPARPFADVRPTRRSPPQRPADPGLVLAGGRGAGRLRVADHRVLPHRIRAPAAARPQPALQRVRGAGRCHGRARRPPQAVPVRLQRMPVRGRCADRGLRRGGEPPREGPLPAGAGPGIRRDGHRRRPAADRLWRQADRGARAARDLPARRVVFLTLPDAPPAAVSRLDRAGSGLER